MLPLTDQAFEAQLNALERGQLMTLETAPSDTADLAFAQRLIQSRLTTPGKGLLEKVRKIPSSHAPATGHLTAQRSNRYMNIRYRPPLTLRRGFLIAAAVFAALTLLLAISPAARAMVVNALRTIGGIDFNEIQQLPPPGGVTVDSQYAALAEVQKTLPFTLQVPTWVPEGYHLDENVILPSEEMGVPHVALNWLDSEGNFIALSLIQSEVGPFQVGEGSVEEILVNGEPVALVRGLWDADTGQWIQPERASLMWVEEGVFYTLTAGGDHPISIDELVRVAESLQALDP